MDRAPALVEGIRILELLATSEEPVAFEVLVREIDMSRASVSRLLKVLEAGGYVHVRERRGGYQPGPRLLNLAAHCTRRGNAIEQVQDLLQDLADKLGISTQYGILDPSRQRVVVLCRAMVLGGVMVGAPGMDISPMSNRHALGKVILAYADEASREAVVKRMDGIRKTKRTILPGPKLDKALDKIRKEGVAIDREDLEPGRYRVAVPVKDQSGRFIGAICATYFSTTFSQERLDTLQYELQEAARTVADLLAVGSRPLSPLNVE